MFKKIFRFLFKKSHTKDLFANGWNAKNCAIEKYQKIEEGLLDLMKDRGDDDINVIKTKERLCALKKCNSKFPNPK